MTATTEEIRTARDGTRYVYGGPDTDDHLVDGHEVGLSQIVRSQLRPGHDFWNIGAHVGTWALRVPTLPEGYGVVAFEANPATAAKLRRNVELNGLDSRVHVVQAAVSDTEGQTVRFVDVNGKTAGGSTRIEAAEEDGRSLTATTTTLDGWWDEQSDNHQTRDHFGGPLAPPGLLMIDVEGHEAAVLRGAEHLIAAHHPNIFVEVHTGHPGAPADLEEQLRAILTAYGYSWSEHLDGLHWICGWTQFLDDEPEAVDVEFAPEGTDPNLSPFDEF